MTGPLSLNLPKDLSDELKRQHLLAFRDFCLDLLEDGYGDFPPEKEIDDRSAKYLCLPSLK